MGGGSAPEKFNFSGSGLPQTSLASHTSLFRNTSTESDRILSSGAEFVETRLKERGTKWVGMR